MDMAEDKLGKAKSKHKKAKRKYVRKPKKSKITRAEIQRRASRLTLREAVISSVNIIGFEEFKANQVDPLDYYSEEELEKVLLDGKKILIDKGKPTLMLLDFLGMWVRAASLKKLYKDNSLIGESARKVLRKKTTSGAQKRILSNRPSNPLKKRAPADHYPTPGETTVAIMKFLGLPRNTIIYEPCCGRGHISKTFQLNGYRVISSDLYDYNFGEAGIDFIYTRFKDYDWIVTNPPFNLAEEFIKKAYANGKPFALLLKSTYFHASTRRELFFNTRPSHALPLTWRPDFTLSKGPSRSTMDCTWFIWSEESFKNLDKPFNVDYYPLNKPENFPKFDLLGQLKEPYQPS